MKKTVICLLALLLTGSISLNAQFGNSKLVLTEGVINEQLKQTIETNISAFLQSCNKAVMEGKNPNLDKNATTKDARDRFLSMWKTSPMSCNVSLIERHCLTRPAGGYQIRGIPVTMLDAPEEEQDQELVFNLTADGKVDDIFIPVDIHQYNGIISNNNEEEDINRRLMVLDFIENFRTAYNRKDLPFLKTVFSNDAIIITGKEVKIKPNSDGVMQSLPQSKFVIQVSTKKEYMDGLQRVFKKNTYINLSFDDIIVLQHEQYEDVYGVTLKQDWRSSTYNDVGYLFLMIDFKNELLPEIHVRTWQPAEFKGETLRHDEIFQMGNFDLNIIR